MAYSIDRAGTEFLVNTYTNGDQGETGGDLTIAGLDGGGFVVAWANYFHPLDNSMCVIARVYDAGGVAATGELLAATITDKWQWTPVATHLPNGFALAWNDTSQSSYGGKGILPMGQVYDLDGNKVGAEFQAAAAADISGSYPAIAELKGTNGHFVVAWIGGIANGNAAPTPVIRFQVLDKAGVKFGSQVDAVKGAEGFSSLATVKVTGLENGGFLLGYAVGGARKVQAFNEAGVKQGGEIALDGGASIIALKGGGFVVGRGTSTYPVTDPANPSDAKVQIYSDAGVKVGGEITVNSVLAGQQSAPVLAPLKNGGFVAVFHEGEQIKAQAFTASGGRIGGELTVNTITEGNRGNVAVAGLDDGGFVVTWADESGKGVDATNTDLSGYGIKAQRFTITGKSDAPTGLKLSAASVLENAKAGAVVGTLIAKDADSSAFTFKLMDDAGGRFALKGSALVVKDGLKLDYEQAKSDTVSVKVTDSDGNTLTKVLSISIRDVNPEKVVGDNRANVIVGGAKADTLAGGGDNDTLKGGKGTDRLVGDTGTDKLYGGVDGATDIFVFNRGDSGKTAATWDQVFDFRADANPKPGVRSAGSDRIDLHLIDADPAKGDQDLRFVTKFTAAGAGQADGQVMVVDAGKHVNVHVDWNGDNTTDMIIQVMNVAKLTADDFLL